MGVHGVSPPDPEVRPAPNTAPAPPLRESNAAREQDERAPSKEQVRRVENDTASGVAVPQFSRPRLRVDGASNRIVAQLVDESGEVIKQIPPEELLRIAARFGQLQGLFFDRQT